MSESTTTPTQSGTATPAVETVATTATTATTETVPATEPTATSTVKAAEVGSATTLTQPAIAAKRGLQTLWQGLVVAAIMATLTAIGASLTAASWTEWLSSWPVWTWAAFQACGTAVVAFLVRRFADTSGIEDAA